MPKQYIITLTASNRVGIFAAVATALAELGGELQEVKQTLLDKFFTMIVSAEFPEHRDADVIVDHLRGRCERFGIEITLKDPSNEVLTSDLEEDVGRHLLTLTGRDEPGLLSRIATRIARDRIDIAEMHAKRVDAGRSFEVVMTLVVPLTVEIAELINDLEEIGRNVGLSAWIEEQSISDEFLEIPAR